MNIQKRAFTLIEILMVVTITAILASIIFISVGSAQKKSRDSRRISDLQSLNSTINIYQQEKGFFPYEQAGDFSSCSTNWCVSAADASEVIGVYNGYSTRGACSAKQWIGGLACKERTLANDCTCSKTEIIQNLPLDPVNKFKSTSPSLVDQGNFFYAYKVTGDKKVGYKLITKLENNISMMADDGGNNSNLYEVFNIGGRDL